MPWVYDSETGEEYYLGEAPCPICGFPSVGYFKGSVLIAAELCVECQQSLKSKELGKDAPDTKK